MAEAATAVDLELGVDELAARSGVPVRTIREYQAEGLLPPPERRGRVGIYRASHLVRLQLIGRLQARGYSLAGIRDLVGSWRDGADLGEVLGLEADQLVHLDEPGRPATLDQLSRALPALVPARLSELVAAGVIEQYDDESFCVPSPSLLQLTVDTVDAGFDADAVLALLSTISAATDAIAEGTIALLASRSPEQDREKLASLATRGRGLLAHGTGRLTVHTIGSRLGIDGDRDLGSALAKLVEVEE